ncbi:methionine aminopeptidase, type II [Methanobacterium lacus]|uniref:Methionine aminopeptidase n=1 Tax=Methanobacterium lacus (strain AL-21) TaxID=877455 RepID=F0T7Y8_METLA|nr:type II methionyl aminopeptidase [Methanobacterium lacus]ADZ08475.1 methionine aminopeptidase, type II [Methanobacterium lacus]
MIEAYEKSGKIVSKVRKMATDYIEADMKILELVDFVESNIIEMGAKPAFPCNISINEITAHYTAPPGDESIIKDGDLVKIDLGAHVDGYIADSAITVLVGDSDTVLTETENELNHKLIQTAQDALESAINTIKAGVELGEIGTAIEETITQNGLNPVSNLTGHGMDQYILHSGISVPNIKEVNDHKVEEGDVLAIEPFVTNGVGWVSDIPEVHIFRFLRDRPMRMVQAKKLLHSIAMDFRNLPFCQRWLTNENNEKHINMAMRQLINSRAIYPYHVLKEKSDARVAQAEHTVIVEADGCKVITL